MNTGLYLPRNESTSKSDFEYRQISSKVEEHNQKNTTSAPFSHSTEHYIIQQLLQLETTVSDLKKSTEKSRNFFNESVLLQRVCLAIIILLPVLMLVTTGIIVRNFSTDSKLLGHANWWLGILGTATAIDLAFVFASEKTRKEQIERIEKRLDSIENK